MQTDNQNQFRHSAWAGAKQVNTQAGAILIKKACEHTTCNHFRCERKDLRLDGIDILWRCAWSVYANKGEPFGLEGQRLA